MFWPPIEMPHPPIRFASTSGRAARKSRAARIIPTCGQHERSSLMRQENGYRKLVQQILCNTAEHSLAKSRMAISTSYNHSRVLHRPRSKKGLDWRKLSSIAPLISFTHHAMDKEMVAKKLEIIIAIIGRWTKREDSHLLRFRENWHRVVDGTSGLAARRPAMTIF